MSPRTQEQAAPPRSPQPFLSVITYVRSAPGLPSPNDNRAVRQVREGLQCTYGVARVRQAHPLSVAERRTIVTAIDRTTLGGARDAAFILLGYAGALRVGELAALAVDDLEPRTDGIVLRIRRSKTDRDAAGAKVAVAAVRPIHPPRRCPRSQFQQRPWTLISQAPDARLLALWAPRPRFHKL